MGATKYLLVKGRAGLGNRMQAVLTGLLYSRLSGRKLIVDWSEYGYSSDGSNSFPKLFTCRDVDPTLELPRTESVYPGVWRGNLHRPAHEMLELFEKDKWGSATIYRKYSVDLERLDHGEEVAVLWCLSQLVRRMRGHFVGDWARLARMTDEEILRQMLREDLRPEASVQARIDDYRRRHFRRPTVGVHIRCTDRRTSIAPFHLAIGSALRRLPGAQLFVATDNEAIEKQLRERYANVISTTKWFPPAGDKMHENLACPDRLQNAIQAMVDMYLLADCDMLIYPRRSTFSYLSSLLSEAPPENILDVERFRLDLRLRRTIRAWIE